MSRLAPFGFLFGKNLTDLIKGIRRNPDSEQRAQYLRDIIAECRDEVRSPDLDIKTTAILKLTYLEMLGYDMTWAGFHVTEVMASPHFQQKRIGYLAAMQSFRSDSELLMLVTNLLKMDLVNQSTATVAIALSGLATIVTPLLAADVADDIMRMLSHSKSYIRKKAVLALHNVVLQYPEALPVALQRIADLLDVAQQDTTDPGNVSVVGATVSVICELATHAPSVQEFLELTPKLYAVFTTSQHNWTLIKLLKIFQLFTKREPRLKSRLLPAVRDMLNDTEAISLIYESMNCILLGGMLDATDFELASEIEKHSATMLSRDDPNLTLVATSILKEMAFINPRFVSMSIVNDLLRFPQSDPITRHNIMSLASKVVNDDTFFDIANELISQFRSTDSTDYQIDVAETISRMSASQNYEFVPDFQWLISDVFTELCQKVKPLEISRRLLDIVVRVKDKETRESVAILCYDLLKQYTPVEDPFDSGSNSDEFFETCWWIIGEFPTRDMISNPLQFMEQVSTFGSSHSLTPAVVTSVVKLVSKIPNPSKKSLDAAIELLVPYSYSLKYELQERSCQFLELLKLAQSSPDQSTALLHNGLSSLFESYELLPIAPGSQQRVRPPDGLDLETPVEISLDSLPSLQSELDVNSDSETELESLSTRSPTPLGDDTESNSASKDAGDRQLYNLNLLDSMRQSQSTKPMSLVRPTKKKVLIAADETVDGPDIPLPQIQKQEPQIFRSGFRGPTNQLVEADEQILVPPPVKVKHKKKVKRPKSEKKKPEQTEA